MAKKVVFKTTVLESLAKCYLLLDTTEIEFPTRRHPPTSPFHGDSPSHESALLRNYC